MVELRIQLMFIRSEETGLARRRLTEIRSTIRSRVPASLIWRLGLALVTTVVVGRHESPRDNTEQSET